MDARVGLLVLAAAALVAGAAYAGLRGAEEATGEAEVAVLVEGPRAERIFEGTVSVANATAYSALLAAAEAGGFEVKSRQYAVGVYVTEIAGHRAEGPAGWVYAVERDGAWALGDRAADRFPLETGARLRWSWTDEPLGPDGA